MDLHLGSKSNGLLSADQCCDLLCDKQHCVVYLATNSKDSTGPLLHRGIVVLPTLRQIALCSYLATNSLGNYFYSVQDIWRRSKGEYPTQQRRNLVTGFGKLEPLCLTIAEFQLWPTLRQIALCGLLCDKQHWQLEVSVETSHTAQLCFPLCAKQHCVVTLRQIAWATIFTLRKTYGEGLKGEYPTQQRRNLVTGFGKLEPIYLASNI